MDNVLYIDYTLQDLESDYELESDMYECSEDNENYFLIKHTPNQDGISHNDLIPTPLVHKWI